MGIVIKGVLSIYLAFLSIWDIKAQRNPWWTTTPFLAFLMAQHLYGGTWSKLLIPWTLITLIYGFHVFGAADLRLLMLTSAMFPEYSYFMTLACGALILLLIEMFRTHRWGKGIEKPTRELLYATGTPAIHIIALPTIIYLWLVQ